MNLNAELLESLIEQASFSPRRRINFDLRNSTEDQSQRMLNALLPDTQLPIHRHVSSNEVVILIKGSLDEIFYDDNGVEIERIHLNRNGDNFGLNIPKGMWHTVEVFEPSVIFEAKDGCYEPLSKDDVQ